jgi:hypothetical protein
MGEMFVTVDWGVCGFEQSLTKGDCKMPHHNNMASVTTNTKVISINNTGAQTSSDALARFKQSSASTTVPVMELETDATTGGNLLLDNNGNGIALNIDQDGNSASKIWGQKITVDNAGAGGVGGIDFSGMSVDEAILKGIADAITAVGTISHQIPIDIGGTLFYLVAYTHGS